jgi:quinoprotein glucose dehydrogenase
VDRSDAAVPDQAAGFDQQGVTVNDLIDFTPELRAEAIKAVANYRLGAMYDPGTLVVEGGHRGTIIAPGLGGGANWQGGAADPETGFVYVGSSTSPVSSAWLRTTRPTERSTPTTRSAAGYPRSGLRLLKPPYGRITAYNMNKGDIAWQIPNGDTPANVKNNRAERREHSEDRQPVQRRPARDEDAAHRRRRVWRRGDSSRL